QRAGNAAGGGGDVVGVEARRADDARAHAGLVLGRQQRLQAGFPALVVDRADDVGGGLAGVGALFDAHDDDDRVGLVGDGGERGLERAGGADLADGIVDVGDEHGLIEREVGGGGFGRGADEADEIGRAHV